MKPKDNVPAELLRTRLDYDPQTGVLTHKERSIGDAASPRQAKSWNTRFAGAEAFTATNFAGYKVGCVRGDRLMAHRVAWAIYHGRWPQGQIDHINGDPSDNRIENLREVSQAINCRNKRLRKDNASGIAGVHWLARINRWQVSIPNGSGGNVYVGVFKTLEEAASARENAVQDMGYGPLHGRAAA